MPSKYVQLAPVHTEPARNMVLHNLTPGQDQWYRQQVLFLNRFFLCQWIVFPHHNAPGFPIGQTEKIIFSRFHWFHQNPEVQVAPIQLFPDVSCILRAAVSGGIENGLFALGRGLVTSIVSHFGTVQIAANGVAGSIDQIAVVVVNAVNLAVITVVGQCVGAREYGQAEHYTKKLMKVSYICTAALGIAVCPLLPLLLRFCRLRHELGQCQQYRSPGIQWYICTQEQRHPCPGR